MSTSLLYHTWGIRGYTYIHTRYEKGCTLFRVEQEEPSLRSACCGSREVNKRGATERTFKTTPVGNRPIFIELPVQRVECLECGVVRQVNVPFAQPRRSYTKGFERYAPDLSRHMTIQDVAHHLNVSWDTIKDIQKRYLWRQKHVATLFVHSIWFHRKKAQTVAGRKTFRYLHLRNMS